MRSPALGLTIAVLLLVGACASGKRPPPLPEEEWDAAHNRHYEDLTQAEFYAAAEEIFQLADGDDFTFANDVTEKNQLVATRSYHIFAVFVAVDGEDAWYLRAVPRDGGIDGNVRIFRRSKTTDGKWFSNQDRDSLRSIAALEMFWARMDYVLGRSDQWPTCDEVAAAYENEANPNRGSLVALCNGTMKDIDPRTGDAGFEEQDTLEE